MTGRCAGRASSSPGARTAATSCSASWHGAATTEVAAEVIDDLARMGYVDDERYAAALAEHRLTRGWGPLRIEHDLTATGVPEAVVNAAIAALDRDAVREAALRAMATASAPPPPAAWERAGSTKTSPTALLGEALAATRASGS